MKLINSEGVENIIIKMRKGFSRLIFQKTPSFNVLEERINEALASLQKQNFLKDYKDLDVFKDPEFPDKINIKFKFSPNKFPWRLDDE